MSNPTPPNGVPCDRLAHTLAQRLAAFAAEVDGQLTAYNHAPEVRAHYDHHVHLLMFPTSHAPGNPNTPEPITSSAA